MTHYLRSRKNKETREANSGNSPHSFWIVYGDSENFLFEAFPSQFQLHGFPKNVILLEKFQFQNITSLLLTTW